VKFRSILYLEVDGYNLSPLRFATKCDNLFSKMMYSKWEEV